MISERFFYTVGLINQQLICRVLKLRYDFIEGQNKMKGKNANENF